MVVNSVSVILEEIVDFCLPPIRIHIDMYPAEYITSITDVPDCIQSMLRK